jgi:protein transport protein SEC13
MKVIIWKEVPANSTNWQIAHMDTSHQASVNDVQFSAWEFGLRVACASSDGTVSVLSYGQDNQWHRASFQAHAGGAQSLSWMPAQYRDGQPSPTMRLVTGGCDCCVTVWKGDGDMWSQEMPPMPPVHTDWVRAVAWRPEGEGGNVIATGGWDRSVIIWMQEMEGQCWRQACKLTVVGKVEGLCWSHTGSILAVSFGSGEAVLYKESLRGSYEEIGKVVEDGATFQEIAPNACQPAVTTMDASSASAVAAAFAPPPAASTLSNELAMQQAAVLDSFGDF